MMKSMAHLLVDGYNLLHYLENKGLLRTPKLPFPKELEDKRQILLEKLLDYQSRKQIELTIVFDSTEKNSSLFPKRTRFGSLMILFSEHPENADEYIFRLCEEDPGRYVVVSNDEEVLHSARLHNCLTMTCREFEPKLSVKEQFADPETWIVPSEEDDDRPLYPRVSTKKKGVARRLPKGERRRKSQLRHL